MRLSFQHSCAMYTVYQRLDTRMSARAQLVARLKGGGVNSVCTEQRLRVQNQYRISRKFGPSPSFPMENVIAMMLVMILAP